MITAAIIYVTAGFIIGGSVMILNGIPRSEVNTLKIFLKITLLWGFYLIFSVIREIKYDIEMRRR